MEQDPPAVSPTAIDLSQLDAAGVRSLRLRPVGLLTGGVARSAIASGNASPLAGTETAFPLVEVLARTPSGVVTALARLRHLRLWAEEQAESERERIEMQLARLSEPRCAWAGLKLGRPLLMGIVNVTPDSFFTGAGDPEAAIAQGRAMIEAGADIIDVGGESTRPGAATVPEAEEIRRIEPVVRALAERGAIVSVDTRKAAVMAAAHRWGARIINDVSALEGDGSLGVIAETGTSVVLMHMRGDPATMQRDPRYDLASLDVADYLAGRIARCIEAGIERSRIVVDPGFGFGKTVAHNLEILARLALLHGLGCGILVGLSRKSTIGRISGAPLEARLPGSIAGALHALSQGAQILRVHDVAETRQAIALWRAVSAGA